MTWAYRGSIPRSAFEGSEFVANINEAVENNKSVHLVSSTPNFGAVDSIVYHPKDPILTCIQITMNPKCPVSVPGLHQGSNVVHCLQVAGPKN